MVLETTTLVDRVPLPSARRGRDKHRQVDWLALFQGTCVVLIEAASFAVSTLLLVLGLPLFVFLLLAGWDLTALFTQLGNLADHYRTAEPIAPLLRAGPPNRLPNLRWRARASAAAKLPAPPRPPPFRRISPPWID